MYLRNVYDFSYEKKALVWRRVVYPLLLKREMCCFTSVAYISVRKLWTLCNINPTEVCTLERSLHILGPTEAKTRRARSASHGSSWVTRPRKSRSYALVVLHFPSVFPYGFSSNRETARSGNRTLDPCKQEQHHLGWYISNTLSGMT